MKKLALVAISLAAFAAVIALVFAGSDRAEPASELPTAGPVAESRRPDSKRASEAPARRTVESRPTEKRLAAPCAYRFVPGESKSYELAAKQTLNVKADPAAMGFEGEARTASVVLETVASLQTMVYEADPGAPAKVGVRFTDVSLLQNGRNLPPEAAAEFSREFVVQIDETGRTSEFLFARDAMPQVVTQIRGLLLLFQIVFAKDPAASEWTVEEEDMTGLYRALYRARPSEPGDGANSISIEKTFDRYERIYGQGTEGTASRVDFRAVAAFDRELGGLSSNQIVSAASFVHPSMPQEAGVSFEGSLVLVPTSKDAAPEANLVGRLSALAAAGEWLGARGGDAHATAALAERERVEDEREIEGISLESLLDILARFEGDFGQHSEEEYQIFRKLSILFGKDGAAVEEARQRILLGRVGPRAASAVVSALSNSGNPAAEDALLSLARTDGLGERLATEIVSALGTSRVASPAAESYLRDLVASQRESDLASVAVLGLGSMAQTLSGIDEERSRELALRLNREFDRASDSERRTILSAMGNSGRAESKSRVLSALGFEDESDRASAVMAARDLAGSDVDAAIASVLANDASIEVRLAAIEVLAARRGDRALTAIREATASADRKVREAALATLANLAG